MATSIEWCDETWNPTVGCSRVSPGCDGCYAMGVAHRAMQPAHAGLTVAGDGGIDWTGEVRLLPDRLETPLRWRTPRRVFVDSMSDLFHPDVPDDYVARVFAVMSRAGRHSFQVLTKRPQRMASLLASRPFVVTVDDHRGGAAGDFTWPLPNVWLGTSVENQRYADLRIPHLLATPAAVRFLSIEPLLGPVVLDDWVDDAPEHEGFGPRIDWVIVGGESGPGARPMRPDWARDLRDTCTAAGVPFLFKQWGEWRPIDLEDSGNDWYRRSCYLSPDGTTVDRPGPWDLNGGAVPMVRVGKKAAGRLLDGRTWDEYPT